MTERESYCADVVKYLRFVGYAKAGKKPTYEMYQNYTKGSTRARWTA